MLTIVKRDARITEFDPARICKAITKAILEHPIPGKDAREVAKELTDQVTAQVPWINDATTVEVVQDLVETKLMDNHYHAIAKAYILYRDQQDKRRIAETKNNTTEAAKYLKDRSDGLVINTAAILDNIGDMTYTEAGTPEFYSACSLATISQVIVSDDYEYLGARILLDGLWAKATHCMGLPTTVDRTQYYTLVIQRLINEGLYDPEVMGPAIGYLDLIDDSRDELFMYEGIIALGDRYFVKSRTGIPLETPQLMFLRMAMGLSQCSTLEVKTIYDALSSLSLFHSTPSIFNAGLVRPQMSSCYISTIPTDSLKGIFDNLQQNANLSKWAGGLGLSATPIRATGAHIKGTNGISSGVVPFLKLYDAMTVAVNQCYAPGTMVCTLKGMQAIETIRPGDHVLGIQGHHRKVLEAPDYEQTDPMVSVTVRHALKPIVVTEGHPVWAIKAPADWPATEVERALANNELVPQWLPIGELTTNDYIGQRGVIPSTETLGYSLSDARIHGYMLASSSHEDGIWRYRGPEVVKEQIIDYLEAREIPHTTMVNGTLSWEDHPRFGVDPDKLYQSTGETHIHPDCLLLPSKLIGEMLMGIIGHSGYVAEDGSLRYNITDTYNAEMLCMLFLNGGVPVHGFHDGDQWVLIISNGKDKHMITDWVSHGEIVYSPVVDTQSIPPVPKVHDLIVEGDESYLVHGAMSHNGGKRRGNAAAYLESWHRDIIAFTQLHVEGGDDYRRTHSLSTSNWIPDLFMERVIARKPWSLLSPDENTLHEVYGNEFKERYLEMEALGKAGELQVFEQVDAYGVFREMLSQLYETGSSWVCFKDPHNLRYTNQHVGVVHSSNLCFTGDTLVSVSGQMPQTFKELTLSQRSFAVDTAVMPDNYWINTERDAIAYQVTTTAVGLVELSDGGSFECTPDHVLFTPTGRRVEAQHSRGVALTTKSGKSVTVTNWNLSGVKPVYCLSVEETKKFYIVPEYTEFSTPDAILVANCTEISLHNNEDEIACCNLGSVVISRHIKHGKINATSLAHDVEVLVRALDGIVDYNFYPVPEAERSNKLNRPLGLGVAGIQDALNLLHIPYDSEEAVDFSAYMMELVSYHAIRTSALLAKELGPYPTYEGSLWSQGVLPIDSYNQFNDYRKLKEHVRFSEPSLDWEPIRKLVREHGMRNSNVMAIAPNASTANIVGCSASSEPTYQQIVVKSAMSGNFTAANRYLRKELIALGLWDQHTIDLILENKGSIQSIDSIPLDIRKRYKIAFEIDPLWLIKAAARRQVWIDQAQSLNIYLLNPTGEKLYNTYVNIWEYGLKSSYYLRTASAAEVTEADVVEDEVVPEVEITMPTFCSLNADGCAVCE